MGAPPYISTGTPTTPAPTPRIGPIETSTSVHRNRVDAEGESDGTQQRPPATGRSGGVFFTVFSSLDED